LLAPRAAQATCTQISGTALAFGTYAGQLVSNSTAAITLAACNTGFVYSVGLNAGVGAGASVTTRKMTSGTNTLNYQIFQNASHSTNWGNTLNVDANTGTTTGATQMLTMYATLLTAQYPAPGTYTDTITATALNSGGITTTVAVSATVVATCTITANPLAFGTYLAQVQNATSTLGATCTNSTPYNIGLNYGTETFGESPRRFMTGPSSAGIEYTLSRDAAHSTTWGQTADGTGVAATGTGILQNFQVYGQIIASQNGIPIPGAYTDTIIATVTY
jgi:spore coat protein U-like protein